MTDPANIEALLRERAAERDEVPPLDPVALERAAALLTAPASASAAQTEEVVQLMADDPDLARAVLLCQSMEEPAPRTIEPRGWIPAIAAAAVLVLTSTVVYRVARQPDTLTSKGDTPAPHAAAYQGPDAIAVARLRNGVTTTLRPGDPVQTGDQLTVFYSSASAGHLAVIAVDANGQANWIVPGDGWLKIEAGDAVALPHAIRVDTGTTCEWLVAVFSDGTLPRDDWQQRVGAAARAATNCRMSLESGAARTVRIFGVTRGVTR